MNPERRLISMATPGGRRMAIGLLVAIGLVVPAAAVVRANDASLAERRQRVDAMSVREKEDLRKKYERFIRLEPAQRQQLRDLHANIAASPDRERLTSVMLLYHEWLQSLTAGERLQLLELPADQRVRAIKKLIERQEREKFQTLVQKSLSVEDREAIFDWLAELALQRLPPGEQQRLRAIGHPGRRRGEILMVYRRRSGGINDVRFLDRLQPTAEERQQLVGRLSQSAQDMIAAVKDDPEKKRLVQSWVNAAFFSRRGSPLRVSPQALGEFFQDLEAGEKDYLNNLPPDRKRVELEQLYMRRSVRRPGDPRATFGPASRRRGGIE